MTAVPRFIDVQYARAANDWYIESADSVAALLGAERFSGLSWDPACGLGTIPTALRDFGLDCFGTDLVDRGYRPPVSTEFAIHDFLTDRGDYQDPPDNIVSNPPFNLAREFVDRALAIALHKVAFLLPLTFLEGMKRARWLETTPLARVHVCSWRVSMPPGELLTAGAVTATGGKKAFAWLVWEHGWRGTPQLRWLHRPETSPLTAFGKHEAPAVFRGLPRKHSTPNPSKSPPALGSAE